MSSIPWPLLRGKTAAITGGTTGIGRAISLEYIRQGCNVAVNHLGLPRDEVHLKSILEEAERIRHDSINRGDQYPAGQMFDLAGDISVPDTSRILVQAAVDRFGILDVFVANAGIFQPADFLEQAHTSSLTDQ
jgi:L-rhamnose 1-dehydrogenase